jgi:hypothetical protein
MVRLVCVPFLPNRKPILVSLCRSSLEGIVLNNGSCIMGAMIAEEKYAGKIAGKNSYSFKSRLLTQSISHLSHNFTLDSC